ncbi:MAG: cytochrome c biogenesis protein CcdA [Rhizobiaceae bacterium]
MLEQSLGGALLAGILSFLSPCILPIVPPYLAWLAGVSFEEFKSDSPPAKIKARIVLSAFVFVLGFSTVFIALGATASVIGKTIAQYFDVLSLIAGGVLVIMGLHFMGLFKLSFLMREARVQVAKRPAGLIGAYVVGLAFAFGWTPCVGPVLAAILFVAGSEGTALRGGMLLAAYSLGIGVPFLIAAAFAGPFLAWSQRARASMHRIEFIMGLLLVVTGVLFMTGQMSAISYWLLETFPIFQQIG